MKVLILTNMFPSKQKPYSGIFVLNQFNELKSQFKSSETLDMFYMERKFTGGVGSLLKYLIAFVRFIPYLFKRYDVIHVHFFFPIYSFAFLYKLFRKRTKIIITFHGRDITNIKTGSIKQKIFRILSKKADEAIAVGSTLKSQIESKLSIKNIHILSAGVDKNVFKQIGSIEKKYDFIFVGSFIERKGADIVINAIKLLNRDSEFKFCFVGSGVLMEEVKTLSQNYNIEIKQNLKQSEICILLNQSRFLLLPSRNEGFPLSTIEAMYCGLPVITSNIPQLQEQVIEGKNGFMMSSFEPEELLKLMKMSVGLDSDKYQNLVNTALNSHKQSSLQYVCLEIYKLYKK